MSRALENLQEEFNNANTALYQACLSLTPLDKLKPVTMWQFGGVLDAHRRLGRVLEAIEKELDRIKTQAQEE
jgi:hypothetical protein